MHGVEISERLADHVVNEVVRATRDGDLFLFVNDAVIGIPRLFGVFYQNNSGTAKVEDNPEAVIFEEYGVVGT